MKVDVGFETVTIDWELLKCAAEEVTRLLGLYDIVAEA